MITFNRQFNGAFVPENLWGVTFNGEDGAHQFVITGVPTGPVMAYMMRADGTTCTVDGTNDGGTATVTLNQDCYNVPGRFTLSIFVGDTGARVCVYACVGTVYRTRTETIIDSGDVVPSLDDVIAMYDDVRAATAAAEAVAGEVSDLRSAIDDIINGKDEQYEDVAMTSGFYIKSGNVSYVDLTPVAYATSQYAIVDCAPGDTFILNGVKSNSYDRAWVFIGNNNNVILPTAPIGTISETIVAPEGAVKVIFNDIYPSSGTIKRYIPMQYGLVQIEQILNTIRAEIGELASLDTAAKNNLVASINEVNGKTD